MKETPKNELIKSKEKSPLEVVLFARKDQNWNLKIFLESYEVLDEELAESTDKQEKLSQFYCDAFLARPDREYSEYEDRFSMPIPKMKFSFNYDAENPITESGLSGSSIRHFLDGNKTLSMKSADVTVAFYGPSKIYNVKAGDFIFIPNEELGENDIISSDKFTGCTAVHVKTDKGVFFGHVTVGSCDIKEMVDKCRQLFEPEVVIEIVRPERKVDGQVVETEEKLWQSLQDEKNIKELKYPEIAYGFDKPDGVNDFSVLVLAEGVKIIENKN